ncbi:MAG: BMC domain-containing protein [Clostridiales bacterium]|nr:BMC domain-containing protein [Clostridiales bacterium]
MGKAVGIVEVYGLTAAFAACDAGCKAADVTVENFDKNKPANADSLPVPLLVAVKFRGTVDNVRAAVDAALEAASRVSGIVTHHIIPNVEEDTEKMLKLNGFDKD